MAWLAPRIVWLTLMLATIGAGLIVRATVAGPAGKYAGIALYAVMMVWCVLFVRPRTRAPAACVGALLVCWLVEALQATGLPARLHRSVPGVHLVLGEVFAWSDMAWYVVGALAAGALLMVKAWTGKHRPTTHNSLTDRVD